MMNSPSNLMNYPDAYGQYYHPTPTPAAMAPEIHYSSATSSPTTNYYANTEKIAQSTTGHWKDPNLYYGSTVDNESQLQALDDYYYYEEDNSRYSNRKGPIYDYYDYDMDDRIHDIRKNNAIFRQGSGDWLGNFVSTALQIVSLVASVLGDGSETSQPTVDRVDTNVAAAAASGADDLDIAMGTLMAYGGKYLREIALSAWEYGTQTQIGGSSTSSSSGGTSDSLSSATSSVSSTLAAVVSASQPSKPYLSTLSQTELEKVGLKAVAAGANPQKLQQAFATAQLQGDWSKLEKLISDELGVAAINPAETGLAAAAQSTVSQFLNAGASQIDKVTNTAESGSTSSGGGGGILSGATNFIDRISNVIDPPPIPLKPNGDPVNPQDLIKNQNILTRFASEFDMMSEMIQFQKGVNQVILGVNNFLGEGPPQNVDRIGTASNQQSSSSSSSTSTVGSSPLSLLTSIPEAIGGAAVAAIKFITPKPSPASKLATPNNPATNTFSTIQPDVDLNQIIFGILGVAALGSVGYGVYANANNKKNRRISYQTSYSKRSVNSEGDQLWSQIEESIIKGLLEDDATSRTSSCNLEYNTCTKLNQRVNIRSRDNSNMVESEAWIRKCLVRKHQCEKNLAKFFKGKKIRENNDVANNQQQD